MKIHFLKILLITALVLYCAKSNAQADRTFTVQAGMSISDVLPDSMFYLYPQFLKGTVVFTNGKQNEVILNYNLILSKMQFIRNSKDTLEVTNPDDVKLFIVGSDTFIYDKVYYRVLFRNPGFMLVSHQYTKILEVRKNAGYGTSSSTSAIDSYSSVMASDNSGFYKLKSSTETLFSIRTDYFFRAEMNEFVTATQKNLIKLFPDKAVEIKKYVKENDLNFKKSDDLQKLVIYVNSLVD